MKKKSINLLILSSIITANTLVSSKMVLATENKIDNKKVDSKSVTHKDTKVNDKEIKQDTKVVKGTKDNISKVNANTDSSNEVLQRSEDISGDCTCDEEHDDTISRQPKVYNTPVINGIKVSKQLIDINYSKGVTISPKYIVIHDTDNRAKGANAQANRNYFANHPEANASAHYVVDDSNIIQALEDNWRGWHAGDRYPGVTPNVPDASNSNSIAIELCVNVGNNFDKTVENGIALTKYLMKKHNITPDRVIRHHDVSGKTCPRMMLKDKPNMWDYFKKSIGGSGDVEVPDSGESIGNGRVDNVSSALNIRSGPSTSSKIIGTITNGTKVEILGESGKWFRIKVKNGNKKIVGYASKEYIKIEESSGEKPQPPVDTPVQGSKKGRVQVSSSLNMRSGPGTNHSVVMSLSNNQEVEIIEESGQWYKVKVNGKEGYVSKDYVKVEASNENKPNPTPTTNNKPSTGNKKGKVQVSSLLNMRSGPGTNHSVVMSLSNNQEVEIIGESGQWYKVKVNGKEGYVSKDYVNVEESNGNKPNPTPPTNNKPSTGNKKGKVQVSSSLNMRSGPGTNYSVITSLYNNQEVEVIGENNGWYKVRANGREGYVSKQYIKEDGKTNINNEQVSQKKKGTVVGVSTNLNVRKGPGKNFSVIAYILPDSQVTVLEEVNDWYKVKFDSNIGEREGYVSKQYIRVH